MDNNIQNSQTSSGVEGLEIGKDKIKIDKADKETLKTLGKVGVAGGAIAALFGIVKMFFSSVDQGGKS
jgi:hypothetical protein